jgi:hypothetical protein
MRYKALALPFALVLLFVAAAAAREAAVPELFVTADRCMACHNGLISPGGEDISIGIDWRASMMANSARDPYWQAAIRRETLEHPYAAAAIEDECGSCHMAMTRFQAKAEGGAGTVFEHLPVVTAGSEMARSAADGASCTVCHQILPENFGERKSFTAGFAIDTATAPGQRRIFGPFDIDSGRSALMRSASRFVPIEDSHIQESELCATCHTVITHALGPDGEVGDEFPEQVPYLEWRHSAYRDVRSCQSCHMPVVDGEALLSSVMGQPRRAVSRHVFRGGNFFMPRILNLHRNELGVRALPQELNATSQRTMKNLQEASAEIAFEQVDLCGSSLNVAVRITNLAGHKLPSAYPSRRAWLRLTVRGSDGRILFESGRPNPNGSISGNANDADPARYEPHHEVIEDADEVQIYESIMADSAGSITTVLLSAVEYAKDNRLLPAGFDKATASTDVAVHGGASKDADFIGGGDVVRYSIYLAADEEKVTVTAELWYQPIAYRWARNLHDKEAVEIDRFGEYYDGLAGSSFALLAAQEVSIP